MAVGNLTFLPWVRHGAASAISVEDTRTAVMRGAVDLTAALAVNDAPAASVTVRLRGPADVVGIDPHEIIRLEPRLGTTDFEPNYFPCVEFDRPDFPWLFTPARADGQGRLRPWLCLVVVRKTAGIVLRPAIAGRLAVLEIAAAVPPDRELPDLSESWAWAHAQVVGDIPGVGGALAGGPELSLSRLLCPRVLAPETEYLACVVPTFELGRRAGLGKEISDADITREDALAPAWTAGIDPPGPVELPVYYHWEFRTGVVGDFESLVQLLHPEPAPDRLGLRAVDVSRPGFPLPGVAPGHTEDIEGALQPLERAEDPAPLAPEIVTPLQTGLLELVNAPELALLENPTADPLVAPPLYGRWHAGRGIAARNNQSWFDTLNLDPRNRTVASFGTTIVQDHQDALMAAAWEQAGDLQSANVRMRRLQLSAVVNASLHARHFARLDEETLLRVSAPAFARIRTSVASEQTRMSVTAVIRASALPVPAMSAPMRRLGRHRGPLTRRVVAQGAARSATTTWIGRLNGVIGPPAELARVDLATFNAVLKRLPPATPIRSFVAVTEETLAEAPGRPAFQIVREGQPVLVPPGQNQPPSADTAVAAAFRSAAREHLARIDAGRTGILIFPAPPLKFTDIRTIVLAETRPQVTIAALARAQVAVSASATPPVSTTEAPLADDAAVETIMTAPKFAQPMYEPLRDRGQELLLPGIDGITANTVLGLKTNRRFIEAYMVGLNVEMGRELLWRGFPTDQRGTYFDQFWDVRTAPDPRPDIGPLHLWADRRLGAAEGSPVREQFVLLLRSDLLRRYPTAIIYATPAEVTARGRRPMTDPTREIPPAFRGSIDPDVSFFGFDISPVDMVRGNNGAGHYIVIQEQPTEPRFGVDVGVSVGGSHLRATEAIPAGLPLNGMEWGRNAAHTAGITRQLPVRISIHASRFVRA